MKNPSPAEISGFAHFNRPLPDAALNECSRMLATAVGNVVCDRFEREFGPETTAAVQECLSTGYQGPEFPYWTHALGAALDAIRLNDSKAAEHAICQLLLNLAPLGIGTTWSMRVMPERRLRWVATWLPRAECVELTADGDILTSQGFPRAPSEPFATKGRALTLTNDTGLLAPHIATAHGTMVFLDQLAARAVGLPSVDTRVVDNPSAPAAIGRHLDSIRCVLPRCGEWIDRAVRYVVLLDTPGVMRSGSIDGMFGVVHVSTNRSWLRMCEMLVHESAHQYFHLLSRLVPLSEDPDQMLYSPFVGRQRPVEKVLLAFHAFTNVETMYMRCGGFDDPAISVAAAEGAGQLRKDLDCVQTGLTSEARLTDQGLHFMETLIEERRACGRDH